MYLWQLPQEVLLRILSHLSGHETVQLINTFLDHQKVSSGGPKYYFILTCFQRLYLNRTLITSNKTKDHADYDAVLLLDEFVDALVEPVEEKVSFSSLSRQVFRNTRPQSLDFVFIREARDYIDFRRELQTMNAILKQVGEGGVLKDYFDLVYRLGYYLNGNTNSIESPTPLLSDILSVMIHMSSMDCNVTSKVRSFTVKSTDIGNYYIADWGQLFGRYDNITTLDLSDNIIKLDSSYEVRGMDRGQLDVLGNNFIWPPHLHHLSLANNFIRYISTKFMDSLPNLLRSLLLAFNVLTSVAMDPSEKFTIAQHLPLLVSLNLNGNNRLTAINPNIVKDVGKTGVFKQLSVKGCNLIDENFCDLTRVCREEGVEV